LITKGVPAHIITDYYNLPKEYYQMTEMAFQSFTAGFLLSIRDVDDPELLDAVWDLKKWCFRTGHTPAGSDLVCRYMKWLSKVCQSLFLCASMPDADELFPKRSIFHEVSFLNFISDMIDKGGRTVHLNRRAANILTQLGGMGRAGPYPTHKLVEESVKSTIELITREDVPLAPKVKSDHRKGLSMILDRLGEPTDRSVHVSLSGSGCVEQSRADGGKGAYMANLAREIANKSLTVEGLKSVAGLVDCLGYYPVLPECAAAAFRLLSAEDPPPMVWGDVLYVPLIELPRREFGKGLVPYGLARILLLAASNDIQTLGHYELPKIDNLLGVPLFRPGRKNKFVPEVKSIPVTASVVKEAARKTRLVTASPAAYVQLGQPINHYMRQWLSLDPFSRVGFEEGDKLWNLLKSYGNYYRKGHFNPEGPDYTVQKATKPQ